MDTIEGNKAIAEFCEMDACASQEHRTNKCYWVLFKKMYYKADEMEFHTSWDWLMPVVQKIKGVYANLDLELSMMVEKTFIILDLTIFADVDTVYSAVLQFIQWYNQNKPI